MAYGMPDRLKFPPSPLWVVPVCIAVLVAASIWYRSA